MNRCLKIFITLLCTLALFPQLAFAADADSEVTIELSEWGDAAPAGNEGASRKTPAKTGAEKNLPAMGEMFGRGFQYLGIGLVVLALFFLIRQNRRRRDEK
ncbi:MAG: hypothetical protein LKJ03_00070 [Enterococcaceae bacterium]|nr:hypothetical protein [Enterococcaceae bacterium]MCI1920187.1 hypothetical protein [Enterococcaceae bacterium]